MYYILIFFILLLYISRESSPIYDYNRRDKSYAIAISVVLVVLAAFRSDSIGDTEGYRYSYQSLNAYSTIGSLVDRYTIYYIGYYILAKLFSMARMPVWVWFGFVEALYLFSLYRLIDKYSKDKIFSILVFATIGLFSFSMAGLKQTVAMAFMFLSFTAFVDKKYWLTALLIFATYYTHQSALVFIGVFPLYYLRNLRWFLPLIVVCFGIIYLYGTTILSTIVPLMENEKWETYLNEGSGYSYVTFIFYAIITLISYLNYHDYSVEEPENARFFLGLSAMGSGLQLLAGFSGSLFRLAYLYTPFIMILIPNVVYYSTSNNKKWLRFVLMGCIIFYFLYTTRNAPYSFK